MSRRLASGGSLPLRVLLACVLVLVVPHVIYLGFVFKRAYDARLLETVDRLHNLGQLRAEQLSDLTQANYRVIDIIEVLREQAGIDVEKESELQRFNQLLEGIVKGGGFASAFFLSTSGVDTYKVVAASNPNLLHQDYSSYRFVQEVMERGETAFLAFGSSTFDKFFFVSKRIDDKQTGEPLGILTVANMAQEMIERLVATEQLAYTVKFSLVSAQNIVFASGDPNLVLRMLEPLSPALVKQLEKMRRFDASMLRQSDIKIEPLKGIEGALTLSWGGVQRLGVEVPIEGTQLTLLLTARWSELFKEEYSQLLISGIIFLVILVVGFSLAVWLVYAMAGPMRRLLGVMNRVSKGDLTARFQRHRIGFELNIIGDIFNRTIDSLRDQMTRAEAERIQKETFGQELKIGQEIQLSILPPIKPDFPGVEIAARFIPAKQVGGDFYEMSLRPRPESDVQDLLLAVADASGKGVSACLYSLGLRSMLRSYSRTQTDVSDVVREANNLFCQDTRDTGMFVTALVAIYHSDSKVLTYTSCGHPPGLLLRADGRIERLGEGPMALGVILWEEVEEEGVQLASGDVVAFYTDGVTEMHNEKNELFGEARFVDVLQQNREGSVEGIADAVISAVSDFRGETTVFDDVTLVILKVR